MKRSGIKRKTPMKRTNPGRKHAEWKRCYHSATRVDFVKWLGCVVCGATPCDNAHIKNGGAGRKAGYRWIVALCRTHHREYDNSKETFPTKYRLDMEAEARKTQWTWEQWGQ